ncbi:putative membrane protein [Clavibacter sepedonicus]|uniref:Membrane protein n=1 Tax=Clavibacter sepedonicus TaxID=31964 RepID=B0RD21_CLASE|nr:putative membrane protein [Clavibacter sepedonicus]
MPRPRRRTGPRRAPAARVGDAPPAARAAAAASAHRPGLAARPVGRRAAGRILDQVVFGIVGGVSAASSIIPLQGMAQQRTDDVVLARRTGIVASFGGGSPDAQVATRPDTPGEPTA